ncbi:MAG TPA: hypothetical protein PLK21_00005, partial [Candidatus Syntrophosphaera sp.]|nr:hypothetical protein [Candidatus Syntrophosphaera sp.]
MRKITLLVLTLVMALGMFSGLFADSEWIPANHGGFEAGTTFAINGWTAVGNSSNNQNHYVLGTLATPYAGSYCAYIGYRDYYNRYYWNSSGSATYSHLYRNVTLGSTAEPVVTLTFWY